MCGSPRVSRMSRTRAVSTTLGYVLTLGIAAILITGLIAAGGTYVQDEREQVIRDELTVIGQQLAADVERTDRLARAGDEESSVTVRLNQSFSDRVTGTSYRISLDRSEQAVVLSSVDPNITVSVGVETQIPVADSTAGGGPIQLVYRQSANELEVQNG